MNDYDTLYDFSCQMGILPHGRVHLAIGGVWNSDFFSYLINAGYDTAMAYAIATVSFSFQKNSWRHDLLYCPTCSSDSHISDCKCSCPDLTEIFEEGTVRSKLTTAGISAAQMVNSDGEDQTTLLISLICQAYDDTYSFTGDSLESASPGDPTFWAIHPNIERLLTYKRIIGFDNETWVEGSSTVITTGEDCSGHDSTDLTVFSNLFDNDNDYYTVIEIYNSIDPNDVISPYIYDNFEWPHCEDEG